MKFHKLISLVIGGVFGFSAAVANADPVSSTATVKVTFNSNIFNGSGYDNVSISYPGKAGQAVSAGRFQGMGSNVVGVPESIFVDGLSNLYMYCYDVYEEIHNGQTVDYTINLEGEFARTLDFLGAVNSVLSLGSTYDPYAWLHPVTGYQGAAIQLGIWESKYDSGWDLSSGSFTAAGLESDTTNWWGLFKNAIPDTASLDGKYVMTFEATGAQDMIAGDPPSNVPEPGSLALMAVALAGVVVARRRNKGSAR